MTITCLLPPLFYLPAASDAASCLHCRCGVSQDASDPGFLSEATDLLEGGQDCWEKFGVGRKEAECVERNLEGE